MTHLDLADVRSSAEHAAQHAAGIATEQARTVADLAVTGIEQAGRRAGRNPRTTAAVGAGVLAVLVVLLGLRRRRASHADTSHAGTVPAASTTGPGTASHTHVAHR